MNRRKRHRNKRVITPLRTEHLSEQIAGTNVNMQTSEAAIIRHDLLTTLITTAILVALLIVSSIINQQTHWTSEAGSLIYRLLHIR